ncbi:MAG: CzcE family metal-binding protein [Betaproteobacteria bacterium]|nr:CzcE family metal-binding protein [Betaproteobacteria bacterium]
MKTRIAGYTLVALFTAAASASALAHQSPPSETSGLEHWLEHVRETPAPAAAEMAFPREEYSEAGTLYWLERVASTPGSQAGAVQAGKLGSLVEAANYSGPTVRIGTATRNINAEHDGTMKIENDRGQSFVWQFDTRSSPTSFALSDIAPKGFEAGKVRVFVGHSSFESLGHWGG